MSTPAVQEHEKEHDALHKLRHSLAHILAEAVREVRPKAKLAFGPPIDTGFYYDFDFGDAPVGEADLEDIENRMRAIIKKKEPFEQTEMTLDEAITFLEDEGEDYKVEYAKELAETGKARDGKLSFYRSGNFVDMCEGRTWRTPARCRKAASSWTAFPAATGAATKTGRCSPASTAWHSRTRRR